MRPWIEKAGSWGFGERELPECCTEPVVLAQVKILRPHGAFDAQHRQLAVHFLFVPSSARPTDERPAQVLAAMRIEVAEKDPEATHISNRRALGGARPNSDESRVHQRPRPECAGRQAPND